MSVTAPSTPTTTPAPIPVSSPSWWQSLELSAAKIYHQVLAAETNVSQWVAGAESNPTIAALLNDAVTFFTGLVGVPPAAITASEAILAALSKLAQSDASVTSGSSPSVVVTPPTT